MDGETEGGASPDPVPQPRDHDTVMGNQNERHTENDNTNIDISDTEEEGFHAMAAHFENKDPAAFLELLVSTADLPNMTIAIKAVANHVRGPSHFIIVLPSRTEVVLMEGLLKTGLLKTDPSIRMENCKPSSHWSMEGGGKHTTNIFSVVTYWQARNSIVNEPDNLKDIIWISCLDLYRGYEFVAFWTELMALAGEYRVKRTNGTARSFDKMFVVTISPVPWPSDVMNCRTNLYSDDLRVYHGVWKMFATASEKLESNSDAMYTDWDMDNELSRILKSVAGSKDGQGRMADDAPIVVICGGDSCAIQTRLKVLGEGMDIDIFLLLKGRDLTGYSTLKSFLAGSRPKFVLLSSDMIHLPINIRYVSHLLVCPTRVTKIFDCNTSKVTRSEIHISQDEILAYVRLAVGPDTDVRIPYMSKIFRSEDKPRRPLHPLSGVHEGDIETFTFLFHSMAPRIDHTLLLGTWVIDTPALKEITGRLTLMGLLDVMSEDIDITARGERALSLLHLAEGDIHMACFLAGHEGQPPNVKKTMARIVASFVQERPFWEFGPNARRNVDFDWHAVEEELRGPTKLQANKGKCYIDAGILTRMLSDHDMAFLGRPGVSSDGVYGDDIIRVDMDALPYVKARYAAITSKIGLDEKIIHEDRFVREDMLSHDEAKTVDLELFQSYVTNWLLQDTSYFGSQARDLTSLRLCRMGSGFGNWLRSDAFSRTLIYREMAMPDELTREYTTQDVAVINDQTVHEFIEANKTKYGLQGVPVLTWIATTYPPRRNAWDGPVRRGTYF